MPTIYVVNGPPGAGKTTAGEAAAYLLPKSAFIDGDNVYHFVAGGVVKPWLPGNQKPLFWKNTYAIMENFLAEGYDIVFAYVFNAQDFADMTAHFADHPEVEVRFTTIVLREEEVRRRDLLRPEDCRLGERCVEVLRNFTQKHSELRPYFLDSSDLTVEQTARAILEQSKEWPVE